MAAPIRKVAVLGAGTMGAAIAAHCANAGLTVDLLDVAPDALTPEEEAKGLTLEDREVRNRIVQAGFERMKAARPAALMSAALERQIRLGNLTDDLGRVAEADWVVEAIVERLEPKRDLMARIEGLVRDTAIVSSNTSGIPLHRIAEGRSEGFRRRFLGTHFFNPPRYLKLLELVPTGDTDPEVLARFRAFAEERLGKAVVVCKDTPNFIANRLAAFATWNTLRYALEGGYSIEEVDALTGPLIGRPKTATFRLLDQVGLDIAVGVADNLYSMVPEDESREELRVPEPIRRMVAAGHLGSKTGKGFYQRATRNGQTVFDVIDLDTLTYRPRQEPAIPWAEAARDRKDLGERWRFILDKAAEGDRYAAFLRDTTLAQLAYAARRIPEIADSLVPVDRAMEWGFAQAAGPFRTWDQIGVRRGVEEMERLGLEVAAWVRDLLAAGHESFYLERGGEELAWNPQRRRYEPVERDPEVIDLDRLKAAGGRIAGNGSASLVDLGDGVLCMELHAPADAIDQATIELGWEALRELERGPWVGLVIASQRRNFCVGANIGMIGMAAYQGALDQVEEAARQLQRLLAGFRYASKPVVAAPHGQTLGGGAEIVMHADRVVAAAETYIGLVEVGAGLVPAGGGCKELLRRVVSPVVRTSPQSPPLPLLARVFETIGTAKVATSALEARELGFLTEADTIVMNADRQLAAAKREVRSLARDYRPPLPEPVYAAGRNALAALEVATRSMQWAGHATEYDGVIGAKLARVLCGGELTEPQWVPEDYLLGLERRAFIELIGDQRTLDRIQHLLTTGKPLRN